MVIEVALAALNNRSHWYENKIGYESFRLLACAALGARDRILVYLVVCVGGIQSHFHARWLYAAAVDCRPQYGGIFVTSPGARAENAWLSRFRLEGIVRTNFPVRVCAGSGPRIRYLDRVGLIGMVIRSVLSFRDMHQNPVGSFPTFIAFAFAALDESLSFLTSGEVGLK